MTMESFYIKAMKSKDKISPETLDAIRFEAKQVLEAEHYLDILTKGRTGIATETPPKKVETEKEAAPKQSKEKSVIEPKYFSSREFKEQLGDFVNKDIDTEISDEVR